jgi:hypothetical protein
MTDPAGAHSAHAPSGEIWQVGAQEREISCTKKPEHILKDMDEAAGRVAVEAVGAGPAGDSADAGKRGVAESSATESLLEAAEVYQGNSLPSSTPRRVNSFPELSRAASSASASSFRGSLMIKPWDRAVEKLVRCYGCDPSRLLDCCR